MIDANTMAAAERLAFDEHNRRVGEELRRMASIAPPAAGKTVIVTAAEARADAAKGKAAADKEQAAFEAEYRADSKLQDEFRGDISAYCAFRRAEMKGKARIFGGRVVS